MISLHRHLLSMLVLLWFYLLFYSSAGQAQTATFTNPVRNGADPWVFQKGREYYYCAKMENGIAISKSASLTDHGTFQKVWRSKGQGWNASNIWAPELHFIDGYWYIYYAAGTKPGGPFIHQRSGVLKSEGSDPFGPYTDMGMLYTGDNINEPKSVKWAIDLTPFEHMGSWYAIWSGWEENRNTDRTSQHLYIAEMSNPFTISSNRVKISSPVENWEKCGVLDLNEGPQLLKRGGKVFIIYSTCESWLKNYRLGQLELKNESSDPMDPSNWEKCGPVFMGTDQVHGVGHCSFARSPDGKEDWILYHSKKTTKPGWERDIRLQRFVWNKDGSPDFGIPVSEGRPLAVPSGK